MTLSVSVKGGFWGTFGGSILTISNENPVKRRIARLLNTASMKGYRELMLTLNGAAAGSAALETHKRIKARENTEGEVGGLRTIETVTDVDANTTADDETNIDETILAFTDTPSTYPVNKDGNPRSVPGGV